QEGIDDQPVLAFERHGLSLAVRVGKEADLRRKAAQSALKARVLGKTDRGLSLDALVREGDLAAVGRDPRGRDVRISRLVARREKEADLFRKAVKGEGDGKLDPHFFKPVQVDSGLSFRASLRLDDHRRGQVDARKEVEPSGRGVDRKSTRLNSSHVKISYAVFCLKKKNIRCM